MEYTRGFYEERRSMLLKQPDTINTVSDCKHWARMRPGILQRRKRRSGRCRNTRRSFMHACSF